MANEYLKRTPTSTGNRKIFTYAGWFKKNSLTDGSTRFDIFNAHNTGSQQEEIGFRADSLRYLSAGSTLYGFDTTNKYRDTGNWFHIVFALNTTLESQRKRSVIYINGVEVDTTTSSGIGAYVAKNFDSIAFNVAGKEHNVLARKYNASNRDYVKGQGFDVFFVDGQALTPDVFGFHKDGDGYMSSGTTNATDFRPGQWMPHSPAKIKKDINRRGGFGVNGFYLPMNDSSNPGADFHCDPNSIIKLKGEDLPQPQNGAPTTTDAFVSQLRQETGTLGFDGAVKFDGTGDYLSFADNSDFSFGGDFTVEAFVYQTAVSATHANIFSTENFDFKIRTNGRIRIYTTSSGVDTTQTVRLNKWIHLALVRQGSTIKVYFDGVGETVSETIASDGSSAAEVGRRVRNSAEEFSGFISNFRVIKGTALYTANFTAPTEPLTAVTNTKLLCCNSSTSATASTVTPGTITANGNAFATRNELTGSIVYALPLISGGKDSGFGDYSNDIRGSGTAKTVSAVTYNSITPTITSGHSPYGSFVDYNSPANTGGYIEVADSTAFDNINLTTAEWTFEAWYKRGAIGSGASNLIQFGNGTDYQNIGISIHPSGRLYYVWSYNGSSWGVLSSSDGPVIPQDEWCHIAIVKEANPTPRIVTYVNGVAAKTVAVSSNMTYTSPDYMRIGGHYRGPNSGGDTYYYNGGIFDARFYSIVKYKGGFDVSKPYTPVGIEAFRTTADTCKNNFATLNSIDNNGGVLSNGNLTYGDAGSDGWNNSRATIGVSSGKWYWEMRVDAINQVICASVAGPAGNDSTNGARLGFLPGQSDDAGVTYYDDGRLYHADSQTAGQVSWGAAYGATDIIGIALDMDDSGGKVWFSKNGSWQGAGNPSIGANPARSNLKTYADTYFPTSGTYFANTTQTFNFGQNPSFSGQVTAGTNADDSGKGLFKYYSPTGFLALCEDNLPTPAIADPGDHFKTVLYTGDGNEGHSITGVGFKPDLVWVKCRSNADDHTLSDTVRGPGLALYSNNTNQENVSSIRIQSFDDNGFTTGSSGDTNTSGRTFCAWCWKAGGAAVSNSDGDLTSQVSVNQDAGFSIVKFTGQGGSSSATVGHGLGKKPAFWIYKPHTNTTNWYMYHQSWGASGWAQFNTTAAVIGNAAAWGGVEPTSTVLTHGSGLVNQGSCILYAWAEIEGYSKFGSYTGNGNTDGPFVYCGFKPAFLLVKLSSTTNGHWVLWDSSRTPTNLTTTALSPNNSWADTNNFDVDLLSNGFKQRDTEDSLNLNGETYIFAAFAESPFQTANAK